MTLSTAVRGGTAGRSQHDTTTAKKISATITTPPRNRMLSLVTLYNKGLLVVVISGTVRFSVLSQAESV